MEMTHEILVDPRDRGGAENDDSMYYLLNDKSYSQKMSLLTNKPLSSIFKAGAPLNQDEFYKELTGKRKGSPYCTAYNAFHTYSHRYGKHPDEDLRKSFIKYLLLNDYIYDTDERSGGSTLKNALKRTEYFNKNNTEGKKATAYIMEMGSKLQRAVQKRGNHAVASSFQISEDFVRDRIDNNMLDGVVHGGKVYNGHAMLEVYYTPSLLVGINNYGYSKLNFFVRGKDQQKKWYDQDFHRKRGVVITYK